MNHQFDADELLALALHDLEKERLESALDKLKAAASQSDFPTQVYAELGRIYSKLKLFERAKPCFERYLKVQPQAVTELFQLGMAQFESNEPAKALANWSEVLKLSPVYPPALFFTAFEYARQGDLSRAKQRCEQVLANVPKDNLYFGRAEELIKRIDVDPAYLQARNQESPRKAH